MAVRPGISELSSVADVMRELSYAMLFIVLPVAIGAILVRIVFHISTRKTGWQPRFSPWPMAVMTAMLSYTALLYASLLGYNSANAAQKAVFFLFFVPFLTAPILVVIGPILLITIMRSRRNVQFLPDSAVYVVSVSCLVAEYLWLNWIFKH